MPEVSPPLGSSGSAYDLWVKSIPISGLLLGPPVCDVVCDSSGLPGEDCIPEGMELVIEYRELLDPLAFFDDDPGEWVRFDECCWPGSGIVCSALCDEELPSLVTIAIESSDPECCLVGRYVALLNGDDCDGWFLDLGTFCGFGNTLMGVGISTEPSPHLVFLLQSLSGSVSISIDLDGDCDSFIWTGTGDAGAYCDGDITVTVTRGSPSGCEVWGLMRWLNIPVGYEVGEPFCYPAPEACCEEEVDPGCECPGPYPRTFYAMIHDVSGGSCAVETLEGLVFPVTWLFGTSWHGGYMFKQSGHGDCTAGCCLGVTIACGGDQFVIGIAPYSFQFRCDGVPPPIGPSDPNGSTAQCVGSQGNGQWFRTCPTRPFFFSEEITLQTDNNFSTEGIVTCCGEITFTLTIIE